VSTFTLNQSRFSKNSVKLSVNGQSVLGLLKSAKETIGGELMYLSGPQAVGKIIGEMKSEFEFAFPPEIADSIKQSIGIGYAETPWFFTCRLYEPGSTSAYKMGNSSIWLAEDGLDLADTGALQTLKFTGSAATVWNGVTALDLAARASDPGSVGALFASFGLNLGL
jgi:hypothetical protein